MIKIKAKFNSHCPQCKVKFVIHKTIIAMPQVKNSEGGNAFSCSWYCVPCAQMFEEIGPNYGSYLTLNDKEKNSLRIKEIINKRNNSLINH